MGFHILTVNSVAAMFQTNRMIPVKAMVAKMAIRVTFPLKKPTVRPERPMRKRTYCHLPSRSL
ncbi:hypothetical protein D3C81_2155740 [compost metagenome]